MPPITYDPILEVRDSRKLRGQIIHPPLGTALVLQSAAGDLRTINTGDPLPSLLWLSRYRSFLVDVDTHQVSFEEQLPSKDPELSFQCTVTAACRVTNPQGIVVLNIRDMAATLRRPMAHLLRSHAIQFDIAKPVQAQQAITRLLHEQGQVYFGAEAPVQLTGYQVELTVAESSQELRRDELRLLDREAVVYYERAVPLPEREIYQRLGVDPRKILEGLLRSRSSEEDLSAVGGIQSTPSLFLRQLFLRETEASGDRNDPGSPSDEAWENFTEWPVSVYLSDGSGDAGERVVELVKAIWQDLGFDLAPETDPILGSFLQWFRAKLANPEVRNGLAKTARAAEVRGLSVPESLANLQNAQALAAIVQALTKETAAAILLGPLLVLKTTQADGTSTIQSKMLTVGELRALERHPELLKNPGTLLLLLGPSASMDGPSDKTAAQ